MYTLSSSRVAESDTLSCFSLFLCLIYFRYNCIITDLFYLISQYLTDNKDFCVVGVIGGQGVGKSTIASMLAGARPTGARRSYMFWPQSRDVRENGVNQTYGVYMAVSTERSVVVLCANLPSHLYTQPFLSHYLLILDSIVLSW